MIYTVALTLGIVAVFILERRLLLRDIREERREWTRERSELLNRIKPETAQVVDFPTEERDVQPPTTDQDWWRLQGVETE